MDEASRTTMWRTVIDEATAKRGIVGHRFRRSHKTAAVENLCGQVWGMSSPTRPLGEGGVEPETAVANEDTGLPQGVSLLWRRPRPQKGS